MMTIEQNVLENLKVLPIEKKQEVLDFTEFLQFKYTNKINKKSLKGSLAHLKIKVTNNDLKEARNEMWRGYTADTE
jgi:hypothetical protein